MQYTPVNLLSRYTPPPADLTSFETVYGYNDDRQLLTETRPDGVVLTRLETLTFSGSTIDYDYVPSGSGAGRMSAISGPYGVNDAGGAVKCISKTACNPASSSDAMQMTTFR